MAFITEEVFHTNDVFAIELVLEPEATNCDDPVLLEGEQDEAFKIPRPNLKYQPSGFQNGTSALQGSEIPSRGL